MTPDASRGSALYDEACRLMPWGTQTNAKRPPDALRDVMPLFFVEGAGCRLRDVDGRWFIDYRCALGPIILGYRHPGVDAAVRAQLDRGVLFSMASPLEVELARRLTARIPGLEQVRFMKTGNDANAAAVRLARAFTGRDHLVTCGYHGYGDAFASGTGAEPMMPRNGNGVPTALDALTTRIGYGDLEALEEVFRRKGDEVAALITVPYDWGPDVARAFVKRARTLTDRYGAVLIFDQVLTGFRLAPGGAQEYFGVIPDLSTYAKALANGYPLSAFGGRRDVMAAVNAARITTTYAGETLSLAAAAATLDALADGAVLGRIWEAGRTLAAAFDDAAAAAGLQAAAHGLPPAVSFRLDPDPGRHAALESRFFRALLTRGIFPANPFFLNAAHDAEALAQTASAFEEAFREISLPEPP